MREGQRAFEDLGHPEPVLAVVVIVVIAPGPARTRVAAVLGGPTLLDAQQCDMKIASRSARGCGQHTGSGRVGALERSERQLGRRVGMFERIDQLDRTVFARGCGRVAPLMQQLAERGRLLLVRRRSGQTALSRAQQVVHERQPAS